MQHILSYPPNPTLSATKHQSISDTCWPYTQTIHQPNRLARTQEGVGKEAGLSSTCSAQLSTQLTADGTGDAEDAARKSIAFFLSAPAPHTHTHLVQHLICLSGPKKQHLALSGIPIQAAVLCGSKALIHLQVQTLTVQPNTPMTGPSLLTAQQRASPSSPHPATSPSS